MYKACSRKVMMLLLTAWACLALASEIPRASPESVGMSSARLQKIRMTLQREVDANRMPGAVVMVARNGKLVYSESIGYQDKQNAVPMKTDSLFRIYSMTKPMVSVATMMLVEDGVLQLTDPVSKFFPSLANLQVLVVGKDGNTSLEPAKKQITVQDLLRHTAGLDYGEFTAIPQIRAAYAEAGLFLPDGPLADSRDLTPAEEIAAFAKVPLVAQPGTVWKYSMSVDLLGRVLEAASGKRLGALLEERLFKPLGMTDTGFAVPASDWKRIAEPLELDPMTGKPNAAMLNVKVEPKNDSGGAGAISTARDYLRFSQMLLNEGKLEGKRYLSPTTIRLMASDHLAGRPGSPVSPGQLLMGVEGYTFGLGFMIRQETGISAVSGSAGEYMWAGAGGTFFWIDPKENLTVVMMAQTPGAIRPMFRRQIKQLVAQAIEK